jgi:hypothetical protein
MKAKLSGFHSQVYTDTKSVSTVRALPLAEAAGPIWMTYLAKCAYKKQEVKYRKPFVTDGTLNRNIVPNVFIEQLSSIEYHSEYNSINRAEFYFVGKDTLNGEPITFSNLGHKDVNTLFEVRKWSTRRALRPYRSRAKQQFTGKTEMESEQGRDSRIRLRQIQYPFSRQKPPIYDLPMRA